MALVNCSLDYKFNFNNKGSVVFVMYVTVTAIVAVFGNLLVSIAILRKRRRREYKPSGDDSKLPKTRNILILNLSIADILMGVFLTIWIIREDHISSMLTFVLCFTSSSCHLAIAVDRFYRIFYFPTTLDQTTERRILYGVSVALWVVPLVMFTSLLLADLEVYVLVTYTLSPVVSFLVVDIIAVLYALIFNKVRKHEEAMKAALGRKKFEKTKLVLKAYATLVVADAVCWMPWIVEALRIYIKHYAMVSEAERCLQMTAVYFYTFSLGLLNASANAVIYWKTLPDINKGVAEIMRILISCSRPTEDRNNVDKAGNFKSGCSRTDSSVL